MASNSRTYARVSWSNDGTTTSSTYITGTRGKVTIAAPQYFTSGNNKIKPTSWTVNGTTITPGNTGSITCSFAGAQLEDETGGYSIYVHNYTGSYNGTTSCRYTGRIYLHTNGGTTTVASRADTVNATSATTVTISDINSATKSGVTFKGWAASDSNTTVSYAAGSSYTFSFSPNYKDQTKSVTFYAVYGITQSFNANGGSFGSSTAWNAVTKNVQNGGASFTIPANGPTRTNYVFVGWAKSSSATNPVVNQATSAQTVTLEENTVWYAVWRSATQIRQHFEPNGGNTLTSAYNDVVKTVASGGSASFTIPAYNSTNGPTHSDTNRTFLGWSSNQYATTPYIQAKSTTQSITLTNNKTWYAVWWDTKITQSFDANGGTFGSSTAWNAVTKNRPTGGSTSVSFTIPAGGPTRRGYKFLGWSSLPDAVTPYLNVSTSTQTVSLSNDRVWYAVWTPAPVYIKLDGTIYEAYAYVCQEDSSGNSLVSQSVPYIKRS